MFGVNGWEIVLLALIAVFVLGPDKLPEYAAKLAHAIRRLRVMAEGAKDQLKDQLGPEYEDINWRQYDPRQYDPRRIVREALLEPLDEAVAPIRGEIDSVRDAGRLRRSTAAAGAVGAAGAAGAVDGSGTDDGVAADVLDPLPTEADGYGDPGYDAAYEPWLAPQEFDPSRPTPYDTDAT
ncbi:twin-arginine translocase TatA/TatE family subunit [Phycicoccus sonneratiae]|uniref:Twin-arginine translocase TatA/TatE family subunit n=1 Tax=Phycicoccus sonneratiae TaxID=2807628 RepID=A0ABS2CLR4_9MICO|nr:twin-arginine translocase TatA/TatE family subunit [Phycicoccus sonneraticus]MBM6400827.1 twin-arginine translocase TatA/TatE family subunit [Phycicoccus sonneraticus]